MGDFISGVFGTACLCGVGILISKLCKNRSNMIEDVSSQYLMVSKEHYEELKKKLDEKLIRDQPALPLYSELSPLYDDHNESQEPVINNPIIVDN